MAEENSKVKHLEMLQKVITTLSHHSFEMKKWCLIILGVIWGICLKDDNGSLSHMTAICFLILCFWGLSSYYLQKERLFRAMHRFVVKTDFSRNDSPHPELYDMNPDNYSVKEEEFPSIMSRRSELFFFLSLMIANCAIYNNHIPSSFYLTLTSPDSATEQRAEQPGSQSKEQTETTKSEK